MKTIWNWGVGIATVYSIFAGATLAFVVFAMRQPVDLVSPEYYAAAQAHDIRQAAASRAGTLGTAFHIDANPEARTVTVTWPAGSPPVSGRIHLYRPSNSHADQRMAIAANPQGVQVLSLAGLEPGNWTVQCEWTSRDVLYYAERQIVMR